MPAVCGHSQPTSCSLAQFVAALAPGVPACADSCFPLPRGPQSRVVGGSSPRAPPWPGEHGSVASPRLPAFSCQVSPPRRPGFCLLLRGQQWPDEPHLGVSQPRTRTCQSEKSGATWLQARVGHEPWRVPGAQTSVPSPLGGGVSSSSYPEKSLRGGEPWGGGWPRLLVRAGPCAHRAPAWGSRAAESSLCQLAPERSHPVAWATPPALHPQPPSTGREGQGPGVSLVPRLTKTSVIPSVTSNVTWRPPTSLGCPPLGPFRLGVPFATCANSP